HGYLHWSLLDNYEWGNWEPTFGLIAVDRASGSFQRSPKPSLAWLGAVARAANAAQRGADESSALPGQPGAAATDPSASALDALTTEQKAALTSGADTWTTTPVPGLASITLSDGPHGLRRQA